MEALDQIGTRISTQRKAKGWTQRELADRLHVTDKAVSKWECGTGYPDISILPPLAQALDVSASYLLQGTPDDAQDAAQSALYALKYAQRLRDKQSRRQAMHIATTLTALCLYGLLLCMRVDRMTAGHLTWSAYVLLGVAFLLLMLLPLLWVRSHHLMWMVGMFSVLLLPAAYIALSLAGVAAWFLPVALPVGLAWIAFTWGIMLLMGIPGRTRYFAGPVVVCIAPALDAIATWVSGRILGLPDQPFWHYLGDATWMIVFAAIITALGLYAGLNRTSAQPKL